MNAISINAMPKAVQRRVIKIYNEAFVEQSVPCPTCEHNCCDNCVNSEGYFHPFGDTEREAHVQNLKERFGWTSITMEHWDLPMEERRHHSQGFFVAGKGCRLPVKERSWVCIGFTCREMSSEQRELSHNISNIWRKQFNV